MTKSGLAPSSNTSSWLTSCRCSCGTGIAPGEAAAKVASTVADAVLCAPSRTVPAGHAICTSSSNIDPLACCLHGDLGMFGDCRLWIGHNAASAIMRSHCERCKGMAHRGKVRDSRSAIRAQKRVRVRSGSGSGSGSGSELKLGYNTPLRLPRGRQPSASAATS